MLCIMASFMILYYHLQLSFFPDSVLFSSNDEGLLVGPSARSPCTSPWAMLSPAHSKGWCSRSLKSTVIQGKGFPLFQSCAPFTFTVLSLNFCVKGKHQWMAELSEVFWRFKVMLSYKKLYLSIKLQSLKHSFHISVFNALWKIVVQHVFIHLEVH